MELIRLSEKRGKGKTLFTEEGPNEAFWFMQGQEVTLCLDTGAERYELEMTRVRALRLVVSFQKLLESVKGLD